MPKSRWINGRGLNLVSRNIGFYNPARGDEAEFQFERSLGQCGILTLAQRMPGFHWMSSYGDYLRETGYALCRVGIAWEKLG